MWGNALKSKLALRFQIPSQASLQGIAKNSSPNRTDDGPAEAAEQPKTDSGLLRTEWLVAYHGSLEYPEDSKGERGLMAKWVETCSMFRYGNRTEGTRNSPQATRHFQSSGLDLRSYDAGSSFAGLVVADQVGCSAEGGEGAFVFSKFADLVG